MAKEKVIARCSSYVLKRKGGNIAKTTELVNACNVLGISLEAEVGMKAKDIAGAVVGEFAEMTYSGAAQTPAAVVTIEGVGEVTGSWS